MTVQEKIYKLRELEAKLLEVILGNADQAILASYSYTDADGSQSVHRRGPKELWDWYKQVEDEIAETEQAARGGGVCTFGVNRYGGGL